MKKIILVLLFVCSCLSAVPVKAKELCPFYPYINTKMELKKGPTLILDNEVNETYWEFNDEEEAYRIINDIDGGLIQQIKIKYNLDNLNKCTWKVYRNMLNIMLYETNELSIENENVLMLDNFLTVCENKEINNEILNLYEKKDCPMHEIAFLLPYFSPLYKEYSLQQEKTIKTRASLNIQAMVNYASIYATTYNMENYRSWPGKDCTNFVSQIAFAGGAKMKGNENKPQNWYYTGTANNSQSDSWINANAFVAYWGVKYSTLNFNTFSQKVTKGSFIAHDNDKDGRYNHCAFVTQTGSLGTYSGKTYKDFKVAQHSSNYHLWCSHSSNGWENITGIKVIVNVY